MTCAYFVSIDNQLYAFQAYVPWAYEVMDQLINIRLDLEFLKLLCSCLEKWDYTTCDEQSKRLRSTTITSLKVIWAKEHKGRTILNRLTETWPVDIQNYNSLAFELEGKIQQSKLQVEEWCKNLVRSSMQYIKSPTNDVIRHLFHTLQYILSFSTKRYAKIVPFMYEIGILNDKVAFLDMFLENLEGCTDSTKPLQFTNFAGAFANDAICLACLYWAKEADEESVNEMSTLFFDMFLKLIPYAPDVTASYISILNSENLLPSDSLLLAETVASSVDFFFEHLNDFPILRDPLILLFTSLSDPPSENAQEKEEDLLRSQIYALFSEHAYFLLLNDKLEDDFSDKEMLPSDFITKIEKANAKIRQLHRRFSDSWIKLEAENMDYIYFLPVQRELYLIAKHAPWAADLVGSQVRLYIMELRLLRVFFLRFAKMDDTGEEIRTRLNSMITSFQGIWRKDEEKGLLSARLYESRSGDTADWHPLTPELEGKIQLSKLEIEAWWVELSSQCQPSTGNEILKIMDSILKDLKDLVSYKAGNNVLLKKQIRTLEERLVFVQNLLKLTMNCKYCKELGEFNMFVQVFANDAACLTFQYWAKDASDKLANETNPMLSRMLQKIKPVTPDVARLYFGALKAIYLQGSDSLLFGQTASFFVDFLFEDQVAPLKDDFQILHDEVIFLLTFLNDPPNRNVGEVVCTYIDDLFWEGVLGLLPLDDVEGDFSKKEVLLSDFMMKIEIVNTKIRQLYCEFPDSSIYNFRKIMAPTFLDFLIQNLRNLKERIFSDREFVSFPKYKIIKIEQELVSLCPFFNHILELQNEQKDTWLQVIDLVHLTEHVIYSSISSGYVFDHPIWYHMAYLSHVLAKIKVVKTKLEKMKGCNMHNSMCSPLSVGVMDTHLKLGRISEINEVVVGFEDEIEKIIGKLTWGHMSFDIVSIVGMGGLGKTTLAKKVYGSSLVKSNFNVFACCTVSQDHNTKKLLLDILSDIIVVDDKISHMTEDDLAHQLWKCLSRQKYLVVLDDIWYVSAWNKIKSSFPDDRNGSRVLITTRSREVADKCKIKCNPHHLRFFSEVESWELLQKKVFDNGISPPDLHDIGRLIAKNCKGLPLAVAVIAGFLARTERTPRWWSEVAEKVVSYLSDEGCMKILELSYNHLPGNLKPCLLYLGAFPEDRVISVKQVQLLWIAEGFIQESKTKSVEDVAKECFHGLVDRNLVIISSRSSTGEIRTFHVHDLIHDLCQTKCRDGNFFQLNHVIASSGSSVPSIHSQYRVPTQMHSDFKIAAGSSLSNAGPPYFFPKGRDYEISDFPLRKFIISDILKDCDLKQVCSLVHLRHIVAIVDVSESVPSSISNLWNIGTLILCSSIKLRGIHLPESFWRMKSLRHVKVDKCILKYSDGHKEHEAYFKLDNVVSFSKPTISTGKDVQHLLQRLPAVQEFSCYVERSVDDDEESVETLDFYMKLELLKLVQTGQRSPYLINFPSTLKKLTLCWFQLPWTAISAIAELECLQVLKLQYTSFTEPILEMGDVTFQNLKFFELRDVDLVQWNASTESFPCLEQLLIECRYLEELPPCLGEMSTLKRIVVRESLEAKSSALRIQEELLELGIEVEVTIDKES